MKNKSTQSDTVKQQPPNLSWGTPPDKSRFSDQRLGRKRKRSGGPRTEEGRAVASMNSHKHGVFASTSPDLNEYYQIRDSVKRELHPEGMVENRLVDSVAHNIQKTQFLQDYERRMIAASQSRPLSASELASRTRFPFEDGYQHLLTQPINTVTLQLELAQAWEAHARPPRGRANEVERMPDSRVAVLYKQGVAKLKGIGLVQYLEYDFFDKLDVVMAEAEAGLNYLGRRLHQRDERLMLVNYWLYRNAGLVRDCINEMRAEMGVAAMTDDRLHRASVHLDSGLRNDIESLNTLRQAKSVQRARRR